MEQHLQFLKNNAFYISKNVNNLTIPSLFEYYSAYYLSEKLNIPFYVWKDLTPTQKETCNFPNEDKGVDIADANFDHLGQSKYYQNSTVNYGKLGTFFGFPIYSTIVKQYKYHLLRSENSKISSNIRNIIRIGNLDDNVLLEQDFRNFIEESKIIEIEDDLNEIKDENMNFNELRHPQIEALDLIYNTIRNVKISLPTGLGKTRLCLSFIEMHPNDTILVLVPTIVLLEQWATEAIEFGIDPNKIYMIGTGYNNDYNHGDAGFILCVYNSFYIVENEEFFRVFIDEAHHIDSPKIYKNNKNKEKKQSYINKIKNMVDRNTNVVMLSATLDKSDDSDYYSYSIREAINDGYISDYQIVCPIFNTDPDDENIVKYLIEKGEAHCVVYTTTVKKCEEIKGIFNRLLPNCAKSITNKTSKNNREKMIQQFNDGQFRFLINVKILAEGFNCPIASSCVFLHIPSSDIFIIQCLGRILRLHKDKKIANLYLPFNTEDDIKGIQKFFKILIKNDENLEECFYNKRVGKYFNLENVRDYGNNRCKDEYKSKYEQDIEIEFRYELVFDSMGLSYKAELLLDFITEFDRVPRDKELYKEIKIGTFYGCLKQGQNKGILQILFTQPHVIKEDYNLYLKKKNEKGDAIPFLEKREALIKFVTKEGRVPKKSECVDGINLGNFYSNIKRGRNQELLKYVLDNSEIIRINYKSYLEIKEKNVKKTDTEEKCELMLLFMEKKGRVPVALEIYQDVKIGYFYNNLKHGQNKESLDFLLKESEVLRKDYNIFLRNKKERDSKELQHTPEEKRDLILKFIEINEVIPRYVDTAEGVDIGVFYRSIRNRKNRQLFNTLLEKSQVVRDDYKNFLENNNQD